MGIDHALACGDCLEFINLHKWSIRELLRKAFEREILTI